MEASKLSGITDDSGVVSPDDEEAVDEEDGGDELGRSAEIAQDESLALSSGLMVSRTAPVAVPVAAPVAVAEEPAVAAATEAPTAEAPIAEASATEEAAEESPPGETLPGRRCAELVSQIWSASPRYRRTAPRFSDCSIEYWADTCRELSTEGPALQAVACTEDAQHGWSTRSMARPIIESVKGGSTKWKTRSFASIPSRPFG
jgi:hypothetical protein